jgi:polyhydroxybutyrate depolymerase
MRRTARSLALSLAVLVATAACSSDGLDDAVAPSDPTRDEPGDAAPDEPTPDEVPAGARASDGCGIEPPSPGRTEETIRSGDDDRKYLRYIPADIDADEPAPVVVDLTAYSPASMQEAFSGFTTERPDGSVLADDERIVVITPEPTNGAGALLTWNYVGTPGWSDDQRFVADLLETVEAEVCVDRDRIFLTGFAVGGVFASITACEQADRFAALATVAGLFSPEGCDPSTPLPVLALHGTGDRFIPYEGGIGNGPADLPLSPETIEGLTFMATRDGALASSQAWASHGGCDPTPASEPLAEGVSVARWAGCAPGVEVELITIEGGEHTWPGSTGMDGYTEILGPVSDQIDATERIWAFFESQTA